MASARQNDARFKRRLFSVCLFVAHMVLCWMWLESLTPYPEGKELRVTGMPNVIESCPVKSGCRYGGIEIKNEIYTARADKFGRSYFTKKENFVPEVMVTLSYFKMDTLFSNLGFSQPTNVILQINQLGTTIFSQSPEQIREQVRGLQNLFFYLIASILFQISNAVFIKLTPKIGK